MGAVNIGVGHDDDLAITKLGNIKIVRSDPGSQRGDDRSDFLMTQELVEPRLFDVQNLSA